VLSVPTNGVVTYSVSSRLEGSTATYSCSTTYTTGDTVRICGSDGHWSGLPGLCTQTLNGGECIMRISEGSFKSIRSA